MKLIRYIKLYRINRFTFARFFHLVCNIFPYFKKCSICNWKGRKYFKDYCPICFSQPRHRLLGYILKRINFNYNKKILFIGAGPCEILISKFYCNVELLNIKYTDYTDIIHDITQENLSLRNYDMIVMWHVLEHIENDKQAVKNIYNMLKGGGIFLFSVPIYPVGNKITYTPKYSNITEKIKKTGHPDHFICPGKDYPDRFSSIGFNNIKTYSVKNFEENIVSKYNLSINHFAWAYIK